MRVLGIESTCDETACAIVDDGREILANVVASQAEIHNIYGGVVPELCCRHHVERVIPVVEQALEKASCSLEDIDLFAVAHAPGLVGALLVGVTAAKGLALALGKPLVGVHHVEAHLYAAIMTMEREPSFPMLGVVLSGGHTALWIVEAIGSYRLLGQTVDDAIGEALDKGAKLLGMPYPGGPHIECAAATGDDRRYSFNPGRVKENPWSFSYSGLKTALLYTIERETEDGRKELTERQRCDLAAGYQRAAFEAVIERCARACREYDLHDVLLGGGVTHNKTLRKALSQKLPNIRFHWPRGELSLDNAAMIAGLGYHTYRLQGPSPLDLEPLTRLPL